MLSLRKTVGASLIILGVSVSCGPDSPSIVGGFRFDITPENKMSLDIDFNVQAELNTEVHIPIKINNDPAKDYGEVHLMGKTDGTGFTLGGNINLEIIKDQDVLSVEKTRLLPNGQALSPYITEDLLRLRFQESEQVATSVYLGTTMDNFFFGVAVELSFINEKFPASLVITQRILDKQKRAVAVATIYGPKVENGTMVEPGGFFMATNISDLIKFYGKKVNFGVKDFSPDLNTYIDPEHQDEFSNSKNFLKLFRTFKKSGKDSGFLKK